MEEKTKPKAKPKSLDINCRFCGKPLMETDKSWGCSGFREGCKATIWKDDFFFKKVFGRKPTAAEAKALLKGNAVLIHNAVIKGKKLDVWVSWGPKEDGKYGYTLDFGGPKK